MMQRNKHSKSPGLYFCSVLGALFLAMACAGVSSRASAADGSEVVDRIVAVVNDEIIVLQEVNSLMRAIKQNVEASSYPAEEKERILAEMRQTVIDTLINQKLVVQAAKELSWLTVSEEEIDATMQRYLQENNLTEEVLAQELAKEGLSLEDLRTQMKESSLSSSLENYEVASKIVITRTDVAKYYNQHSEKYSGRTTYHLRNIFINAPASGSASEKAAAEAKLTKIQEELAAGKPFETLAREYSETSYAHEGGELGNFELEDLSPNLRAAIEPLSAGEATLPIKTGDGYQILYIQEIHKEANVPLESVYSDIENELYQKLYAEKRKAWVEGLRENAHIKIIE